MRMFILSSAFFGGGSWLQRSGRHDCLKKMSYLAYGIGKIGKIRKAKPSIEPGDMDASSQDVTGEDGVQIVIS